MGRTVIVGDVHGCRRELEALLDGLAFTTGDRLVFVGDLVARGPDSLGVLDVARRTGAVIVRGNHEEKLLAWRVDRSAPLGRLHAELADSLRDVDWSLLETAPYSYDLPEHAARVVHAGVLPGVPFEDQNPSTLLHIRTVSPSGKAVAKASHALWGSLYTGPPHMVFGHNALDGLQFHPWATGLDTGCVYGGRLTALVLAEKQRVPRHRSDREKLLVSQPAARVYFDASSRRRVFA
jgi:Calcineurin-like phosphoesterase